MAYTITDLGIWVPYTPTPPRPGLAVRRQSDLLDWTDFTHTLQPGAVLMTLDLTDSLVTNVHLELGDIFPFNERLVEVQGMVGEPQDYHGRHCDVAAQTFGPGQSTRQANLELAGRAEEALVEGIAAVRVRGATLFRGRADVERELQVEQDANFMRHVIVHQQLYVYGNIILSPAALDSLKAALGIT